MDNFDLKKYLSNNPLLKENQDITKLITPIDYIGSRGLIKNYEIDFNLNGTPKDGVAWIKDDIINSIHFYFGKNDEELRSMKTILDKNNIKYKIENIEGGDVELSTTSTITLSNPDLFKLDENKENQSFINNQQIYRKFILDFNNKFKDLFEPIQYETIDDGIDDALEGETIQISLDIIDNDKIDEIGYNGLENMIKSIWKYDFELGEEDGEYRIYLEQL